MWIGLREDHAIIRLLATSAHAVRITARNLSKAPGVRIAPKPRPVFMVGSVPAICVT